METSVVFKASDRLVVGRILGPNQVVLVLWWVCEKSRSPKPLRKFFLHRLAFNDWVNFLLQNYLHARKRLFLHLRDLINLVLVVLNSSLNGLNALGSNLIELINALGFLKGSLKHFVNRIALKLKSCLLSLMMVQADLHLFYLLSQVLLNLTANLFKLNSDFFKSLAEWGIVIAVFLRVFEFPKFDKILWQAHISEVFDKDLRPVWDSLFGGQVPDCIFQSLN